MANSNNLDTLRTQLSNTFTQAWRNSDEAQELEQELRGSFTQSVREAYKECATGSDATSIIDCLEEEAKDQNFSEDFRDEWEEDDIMSLRKDLKQKARNLWTTDMRNAVRKITKEANIRGLYKKCSRGNYTEVSSELGDAAATPATYQECLRQVSEAKDLSTSLYDAWAE